MATTTDKGTVLLEISSGLHAADLLAAERIETWLNQTGLQSAAELLPRTERPARAGAGQLSFSYKKAA